QTKDEKMVVGGSFHAFDGVPRSNVARLNADGSVDTGFVPPVLAPFAGEYEGVGLVALQADYKVLMAGRWATIDGVFHPYFARPNTDGSLDAGFPTSLDGGVPDVLVQPDGHILLAGSFQHVNGVVRNRLARLNADGSLDAFETGTTQADDPYPLHLALQPDG